MKKILYRANNQKGVVMLISIMFLFIITAISIGMITNAILSSTMAKNYTTKVQSFYASDGQMTLLAQEVLDSNENKYLYQVNTNSFGDTVYAVNSCTQGSQQSGYEASKSYDKNESTRWSGDGTLSRAWIQYNLGAAKQINKVRIKFYLGSGGNRTYPIKIEAGGVQVWSGTTTATTAYWEQSFTETNCQLLKITMTGNNSEGNGQFGFWEIQIVGINYAAAPKIDTLVSKTSITMTASSVSGSNPAASANDNNTNTRWQSASSDPQWIYADCGSRINLSEVVINWYTQSAKYYTIQGSNDVVNWTNIRSYSNTSSVDHRMDTLDTLSGSFRYIRMYGTMRNGSNGYSVYEMNIYAYKTRSITDTTAFGDFQVVWTLQGVQYSQFSLQTRSYALNTKWGTVFQTPLNQFIERQSGQYVNPWGDTARVPVTFYDFHSNRTNPEFEQPNMASVHKGMVQQYLDSARKPVAMPNQYHLSRYIQKWFRPWQAGDSTIPIYKYTTLNYQTKHRDLRRWSTCTWGLCGCPTACSEFGVDDSTLVAIDTILNRTDTAFKNIIIQDTLKFVLADSTTGTYRFNPNGFWPLDAKGFGKEWNSCDQAVGAHNFSFTMEIKRTFVMMPGLKFCFVGDDDIWLFLNNRLEMDLGGVHPAASDTVLLDTVAGLQNLQTYNFDFFYCERHCSEADIEIMTNLLEYKPITTSQRHWNRDYGYIDQ